MADKFSTFFFAVKGPAADATDAPQPQGLLCNPVMKIKRKIISFFIFPSNGAPVEWNWQGKTEVLGEKICPSATLSTTNPTRTDPGSNLGLRGERPANNRLSHGTARLTPWSESGSSRTAVLTKFVSNYVLPCFINKKIYKKYTSYS